MPVDYFNSDAAFLRDEIKGTLHEMTYAGALSFLRRKYTRDLRGVDIAVSGIPFDGAVTNRPGCRFGPRAIRSASTELASLKAFPFGFDIFDTLAVVDYGDCALDPHDPSSIPETITRHARHILGSGAKMLTFGGDHFVSNPLIRAHAELHGPVALVQFDAHCDTWDDGGSTLNHGSMFLHAKEDGLLKVDKSIQVGLRSYNDSDHGFEILTSPWVHRNGIDATLNAILERVGDAPCYISFDIDCLDPAFAPGTGTPVPGGLATWQALELIRGLAPLNMIGFDLVEVSPAYDHADVTAMAAANIAHDWLAVMAGKAGATSHPVGRI
ncbi:agmatinase [Alphaproteobacteria bacterium LSUCC0684]